jgi:hypothetical protein
MRFDEFYCINKFMHRNPSFSCIHIIKYKKKNWTVYQINFVLQFTIQILSFSQNEIKKGSLLTNKSCLFYSIWAVWWFDSLSIEGKSFLNIDITFCKIFFDFGPPKTNISYFFFLFKLIYFLRSTYRRAINLSNSSSNITGREIFITAHHSSNESGHIWNTV